MTAAAFALEAWALEAVALDLGTTSIKAGLLNQDGALSNIVAHPAPKIIATDGRYESDVLAYLAVAEQVLSACISPGNSGATSGVTLLGLCSQRSSFVIWEKATGQPLTPLISWQDNRGAASCAALRAHEPSILSLAGLPLTPYYFAPKLRTVLLENPALRSRLERGELLAGTLDTFLIWRWSGGKYFLTDASMAARTLLMDIRQQQWSPTLCDLFGIPIHILPQIKPSTGMNLPMNLPLNNGLTLQASVADQSAALIASISEECTEVHAAALANLGTGCFVVRYLVDKKTATGGYLQTLVYQDSTQHAHFAVEGTLNSIAAALAPYPVSECQVEDLGQIKGSKGNDIFCLAEPSGLGAPFFRNDLGIFFSEPVEHLSQRRIAVLLLEAVIFRVARILEDFHHQSALERVYLSGGLSELACLQQGIAQCVPFNVYLLQEKDSSLHGASLLAAGMSAARNRQLEKVLLVRHSPALPEKYQRWKSWLDDLLITKI